jgi:hypothetical protein
MLRVYARLMLLLSYNYIHAGWAPSAALRLHISKKGMSSVLVLPTLGCMHSGLVSAARTEV